MRKLPSIWVAGILLAQLSACGGGGGSAGTATGSSGASATAAAALAAKPSMTMEVRSGAGIATTSISVLEIAQVVVTLKNSAGQPILGEIVTFGETGSSGLLSFSPVAKTALTTAPLGEATVEVRAANLTAVGATTITASATVSGVVVPPQSKNIQVTNSAVAVAIDPQAIASALNFLDVNPSDKSIVIQGAGGSGRSESATLRFRVVDMNNSPVKGAKVTFEVVPSSAVTLNIPQATSDADGVVVTTVSSKSAATSVVIKATVTRTDGSTTTSQSDQLLVSTGVATQAGFDLSATKYNLNSSLSGDKSIITVRVVDKNGNPVADGVPVVFSAAFGAVGTSSRGGCVTLGGLCSVDYVVQDPRPADGQLALVTASTQLGDGTSISKTLPFRFSSVGLLNLFDANNAGNPVTKFDATTCAKQNFSAFAGTPGGFPAPAGTNVTTTAVTSGVIVTLKSSTPIADQISTTATRTPTDFEVDLSGLTAQPCDVTKATTATALFDVKFTATGTAEVIRRIQVTYKTAP